MTSMPEWIVSVIFWATMIYLEFQMIKRLATAEEELMDLRYELRAARRNIETLHMIVKMQREELAAHEPQVGRDSQATVAATEEDSLEEGEVREVREPPNETTRRR